MVMWLGSYGDRINPTELFWNAMKIDTKEKVGENLNELTDVPEAVTQMYHWVSLMNPWALEAKPTIRPQDHYRLE